MNKYFIQAIATGAFILLIQPFALAQGMWMWVSGDTLNNPPNYGVQGVPAPTNSPAGRYEGQEWTAPDGKLWLYGGQTTGFRSDMWMFDPSINQWTWISGANNNAGVPVYGVKGVPAPGNSPGTKSLGAATWVDANGDFWMYGGMGTNGGVGSGNDMWKYIRATDQWAWMHGDATGNLPAKFTSKGIFSATNTPGGRQEATCSWTGNAGKLWFFGGQARDTAGNGGTLGDLWCYDPSINQWAWMGGGTTSNHAPVYGTKGVPNTNNHPGARAVYTNWKDLNGNLWLWGGSGYADNGSGLLNDLWKYDISTGEWTWVSGSKNKNNGSTYGTKCVPSTSNKPGCRSETRAEWTDLCGHFWLYGGMGKASGSNWGHNNDLWRYNPNTNEWTWISGDNTISAISVMGTMGVPSPTNKPGGVNGAHGWLSDGGLWLMGGVTTSGNRPYINALWKFIPERPTVAFTQDTTAGCAPLTVNFTNNSIPNCDYIKDILWKFDDPTSGANDTSTLNNPSHTFLNNGTYNVKLIVTSCTGGIDSVSQTINVSGPLLSTSSSSSDICIGEQATLSVSGANTYNWSPSTGLSSTTGNSVVANPSTSTTYTVIGDAGGNCITTATLTVNVSNNPEITVTEDDSICKNSTIPLNASGAINYNWSPSSGLSGTIGSSVTANPVSTTTFVVIGSNAVNCKDTANVVITVLPPPVVYIGNDTTINVGSVVQLNAGNGNGFVWTSGNSLSCDNCANPIATPTITTTYYVTVTDEYGCSSMDSITIYVENECLGELYIPTAFSPNGDGQNDQYCLQNYTCIKTMNFIIFDRWGNAVFETTDPSQCWDGTNKGKICNSGVFVYAINALFQDGDSADLKGNITLLR